MSGCNLAVAAMSGVCFNYSSRGVQVCAPEVLKC